MKKTNFRNLITAIVFTIGLCFSAVTNLQAQRAIKTDSRILHHGGPVMAGTSGVYAIWYGNWAGSNTPTILTDLITNLGSSPYFLINAAYHDSTGGTPSGGMIYAGSVYDPYSHGSSLTEQDLAQLVEEHITSGTLLLDPNALYLIIASADVTDLRSDGVSGYCTPGAVPYHHSIPVSGTMVNHGFVGSALRCPTNYSQFPPYSTLTPNGNFEADGMASALARVVSAMVTNPRGNGWYDRYGLQNSDKCVGTFGTTYTTSTGARANMRLGQRDYLIQQNWVNDRRGGCALSND